jgi:PAS domain S-box-containing protein
MPSASPNRMNSDDIYARYLELLDYVGWQSGDVECLRAAAPLVGPRLPALVDDFYVEIQRHPQAAKVITGGEAQIARLKGTLLHWLKEFFGAQHDRPYVLRRWQIGWRHVEIGLRQVYVNAAMHRLRSGIVQAIHDQFRGDAARRFAIEIAIHRAIDIDLALIQDAYEAEKHTRSEAAFRHLVEAAGCAIVILRKDHSIAYFNPFAERMTGYRASDLVGKNFLSMFVPSDRQDELTQELRRVQGGSPAVDHESNLRCHDGSLRRVLWNARRLEDFAGSPAVLAVGHDITELRQAQERVLQAERLAAIGQTVAGLAHESRNAFQRSQACLELLALEVEDRPEALELVQRIGRAQDHLHQLYEEVRSYAAPINLDRRTCDLVRLWRDTWEHLDVSRRDKLVTLRETIASADPSAHVDPFAIGQVFRNVFENAMAACPNPGVIEIHAEDATLGRHAAICITFSDNGPGLSAEVLPRVFEPFYTTKTKGTGLGMAIAKRIVDAHNGRIEICNRPEGGARITITLLRNRA